MDLQRGALMFVCGTLWACAACSGGAGATRLAPRAELPGVSRLVAEATAPVRRDVRKPVRDARARALHELATATASLLERTTEWDTDARLVALNDPTGDVTRASIAEFRAALREVRAAAERGDVAALRKLHERALVSYERLGAAGVQPLR